MLFWAVPMSTEDQKTELEYIYEAAKPNGYDIKYQFKNSSRNTKENFSSDNTPLYNH
jgi:hypothetical protein